MSRIAHPRPAVVRPLRGLLLVLPAVAALALPATVSAADCPKTTLSAVEAEVMCPVCGTPLGLASEAPQANRERALIQRLVDRCRSKEEIKDVLVAQYGPGVLALPEAEGFNLSAYLVPALVVLLAAAGIALAARRWRRGEAGRRPRPRGPDPRLRRRQAPRRRPRALRAVIGADTVDTTVVAAFAVGFVSFISPCVLPLVPGYLSTISGVSFADIEAGKSRREVLWPALIFCLSFSLMFIALGMTATGLGQTLQDHRQLLREISGVVLMLLGGFFIATLFVSRLNRQWRPEALLAHAGTGGPIVAGLAFAIAWLPCTGPTLGAVLTAASNESTVGQGGVLLAFYALGLAVPFILSALAFERVSGIFRFFRNHYAAITLISGAILIAMGYLLFTNELTRLNAEALS